MRGKIVRDPSGELSVETNFLMGKGSCTAEKTRTGLNSIQKGVEMWTLTVGSTDCSSCSGVLLAWVLLGFYPFPVTD